MATTRAARGDNGKERIRLSLDVSPELNNLIEDLAARTHGTKSDVLRKAIALMDVAVSANEKGMKVGIADDDRTLNTEFVGLGVRRVPARQDRNAGSGGHHSAEADTGRSANV